MRRLVPRLAACGIAISLVVIVCAWTSGRLATAALAAEQPVEPQTAAAPGNYVLLGWSELGMHCINPRYREMALLPPANDINAIVIQRGEEPRIVTSGMAISYYFPANTTVVGKTDFWLYSPRLFGRALPTGIGLTGFGLSGRMRASSDRFVATALPVLPYDDNMTWNPYQVCRLVLNKGVARATIVVPVSAEMNCAKCHATGGVAARTINAGNLERNILTLHDMREKTSLMSRRPVLCAKCHSDNALGAAGQNGVSSLSAAMHIRHGLLAAQPTCYDCHPGTRTQCNRSAINGMGPDGTNPRCVACHGNLTRMARSLKAGREPWLNEPNCASCHGAAYSTGKLLYRQARGHGGVPCAACHNSPHAWWPSMRSDDNALPMALQGNTHAIGYNNCVVCHTDGRTGTIPPHNDDD